MKKLWAILLGAGIGTFVIGGVVYGAAVAVGAKGYQTEIGGVTVSATRSGFHIGGLGISALGITEDWDDLWDDPDWDDDDDWDDYNPIPPAPESSENQTASENAGLSSGGFTQLEGSRGMAELPSGKVESVSADLQVADLKIVSGNSLRLEWEHMQDETGISWKLEDGTLYLTQEKADQSLVESLLRLDDDQELKLVLPQGKEEKTEFMLTSEYGDAELQNITAGAVEMKLGTGDVDLENCTVEGLRVVVGTGDLDLEQTVVNGEVTFDSGTGDVSLERSSIVSGNFVLGLGDFEFSGKATGDMTIQNGTGDISMRLEGPAEQHSYELKTGLGEIKINRQVVQSPYQQTNGESPLVHAETGMGDIEIEAK